MNEYDYIIDAFTRDGNNTNLEVDNLTVGCIESKNNNFSLDSNGNLTVNSITTSGGGIDFDRIYPIGAVYISVVNTNPGTLFGGTWEAINGRFLLAEDTNHVAGTTGGEATHSLLETEMPSHTHVVSNSGGHNHNQYFVEFRWPSNYSGTKLVGRPYSMGAQNTNERMNTTDGSHSHSVGSSGDGLPHNNMPPYLSVYMWKRTM